jgi:hypothetical protein
MLEGVARIYGFVLEAPEEIKKAAGGKVYLEFEWSVESGELCVAEQITTSATIGFCSNNGIKLFNFTDFNDPLHEKPKKWVVFGSAKNFDEARLRAQEAIDEKIIGRIN